MSLTKLSLAGNNFIFPCQGKFGVTSQLGTGKFANLFLQGSIVYRGSQMNNFGHIASPVETYCNQNMSGHDLLSFQTFYLLKCIVFKNPGSTTYRLQNLSGQKQSPPKPI
jgi:hypothetical protein